VRRTAGRVARAMVPVRVGRPMATLGVVCDTTTSDRVRPFERLGSCLPTRAPPAPPPPCFHRPRPTQPGDSPG
jgi:hypothetical protein